MEIRALGKRLPSTIAPAFVAALVAALVSILAAACAQAAGPDKPRPPDGTAPGPSEAILQAEAWTGSVWIVAAGSASSSQDENHFSHSMKKDVEFKGDFSRVHPDLPGRTWRMVFGNVEGGVDDETIETYASSPPVRMKHTYKGSLKETLKAYLSGPSIREKSIILTIGSDSFDIRTPEVLFPGTYVSYGPDDFSVVNESYEEADGAVLPEVSLKDLPYPGNGSAVLSGHRSVTVLVSGAGGDAALKEVTVTWDLKPCAALPPLDPAPAAKDGPR